MKPIKIAIADDYTIYRDGLKIGLTQDENLEVMLEAGDGEDLIKGIETNMPDVIIMDLKMPVMDGMEATKHIKKKYPDMKILVVTMYDDEKFVIHLMEIGANGYLLKNAEAEEIRKAIYSVHETGYYFNNIVSNALLKKLVIKGNIKPSFKEGVELTEREQDVLKLICAEKTANEMGKQLFLSPRSVEGIRQRLIDKVGVRNTAGLVMFAVKNGII
ncbi:MULTISPECIES: response regulator transcription factor [Mucilaginibacter]|uniref:DNA-binding response regulator, NarL/FixJ family, contains REC and HTH domains n=1 Tax=Mucilaginibacter gossypii TaxID=551996 RepID=A0A1G7R9G9_9SPHI|nr:MULTISPECIES: response regulator transcription factor [Mucilaginibacter]NVM62471.1 DNA-binding NarL/FixJ family response regulator [Mucilaginibacter sp. SG538B]QTE37384.1 response regulator transcription factor [Mucilaginibacter gossypii]RAV57333.1 DNA-binding response regulator [Mucilaginibacter rubeus]WEA03071.1 response regulator transcription factor [Mucilaginibacter sp. SJ]SCW37203.1 two component transcriptional regulator, LuxR family [Mucilaginibacter sp. NFR10]